MAARVATIMRDNGFGQSAAYFGEAGRHLEAGRHVEGLELLAAPAIFRLVDDLYFHTVSREDIQDLVSDMCHTAKDALHRMRGSA